MMTNEYAIDSFLSLQYENTKPRYPVSLPLKGIMTWQSWREELRSSLRTVLGMYPFECPPPDIQIIKTDILPGIKRTFLTFMSEPGLKVPTYYLEPENAVPNTPAVIAVCGHGYGARDLVGLDEEGNDKPPGSDPGYQINFALELCRRGFIVIVPEMLGFGYLQTKRTIENSRPNQNRNSCYEATTMLMMSGRTTCGVRILQCQRAIEVLKALGYADTERLGCMGCSGGGLVSSFLSAVDERIKVCVASGFPHVFRSGIMAVTQNHCIDNYFKGILRFAELPDILSLIAPRPMLWESADKDIYFPRDSVREAAATLRGVYTAHGVPECFAVDEFAGDHRISGAKAFDFLKKWL